jgi:hypothetical protein
MTTELVGNYLPITFDYKDAKTGEIGTCTLFIHKQWIETGKIGKGENRITSIKPRNIFGVNMQAVLAAVTGK